MDKTFPLGTQVRMKHHPEASDATVVAALITFGGTQYRVEYLDKAGIIQDRFFDAIELEVKV